jgi:hypothetical protein
MCLFSNNSKYSEISIYGFFGEQWQSPLSLKLNASQKIIL